MKRKQIIATKHNMLMESWIQEGADIVHRIIPTPPGKHHLTVTRLNKETGRKESVVYIVRHDLGKKMDLSKFYKSA